MAFETLAELSLLNWFFLLLGLAGIGVAIYMHVEKKKRK